MITRLRLDAALYNPPPRRHPGHRGRPRVVGKRQLTLKQRLANRNTRSRRLLVSGWYGRGERTVEILSGAASTLRNSGTPQFWKIFLSCLQPITRKEDFAAVQATKIPLRERIANELGILEKLRGSGIWLVDASIAALYTPGQPKRPLQVLDKVVRASWDSYTRSVIANANPAAILCIGIGVAKALRSRLNELSIPWAAVPQPQARLSSEEHFRVFETYHRVSADPAQIHSVRSACESDARSLATGA